MEGTQQHTHSVPVQRLSRWLIPRLGVAMLLASTTAFLAAWMIVERGFAAIEAARIGEHLQRSADTLQRSAAALIVTTRDYASWDDTYAFVTAGDAAYIEGNYQSSVAENLDVDWVAFVARDHSLAAAQHLREGERDRPLPTALATALQRIARDFDGDNLETDGHLLLWVEQQPVLIAHSAISDADRRLAPGGWMFFGRTLRPGVRALDIDLDFAIRPVSRPARLSTSIRVEAGAWVGERSLAPWPAVLSLREPPAFDAQKHAVLWWIALSTIALSLLFLFWLAALLRRRVLLRLERFAVLAEQRASDESSRVCWPIQGNDEIDLLARALNGMMARIEHDDRLLAHLASHDPLTALGNRRRLIERLNAALDRLHLQPDARFCLVLADIDRFKAINDVQGHAAGDRVLQIVAERIQSLVRDEDVAVRLGGDEFAILIADAGSEEARLFSDKLLAVLGQAIEHEQQFLFATASIGMACVLAQFDAHELLRQADLAMYRGKRSGRNRAVLFDASLDAPPSAAHVPKRAQRA